MRTGIVRDERYKDHDMGSFHVESPLRLEAIYRMLDEEISFPLVRIEPRRAAEEELSLVHTESYVETIKNTADQSRVALDPDTSTCAESYDVARLAVGGVLESIDRILAGEIENGFALVRPPGHHAEADRAMGFCLFNNIAIGAEYLVRKHGLKRILIVDWDLHHGNGTQHSFEGRSDILFFSTHQYPHYPGSGHWRETGTGDGEGYTINVPLVSAKSEADFLFIYDKILAPITSSFKPEFILVSAGFDIYEDDPLGGMNVSGSGFGALAQALNELALQESQGRILFALEGGYELNGLREGVKNVLSQFSRNAERPSLGIEPSERTKDELVPVIEHLKNYWPI